MKVLVYTEEGKEREEDGGKDECSVKVGRYEGIERNSVLMHLNIYVSG